MKKLMSILLLSASVFSNDNIRNVSSVLSAESQEMKSLPLYKSHGNECVEDISYKVDEHGRTALMHAAYSGNSELVSKFVNSANKMQDENGKTALMLAAQNGHKDIVSMLMKYESGMQDERGMTAQMWASVCGHVDVVKLLSKSEAGFVSKNGTTALMYAIINDRVKCAKILFKMEDKCANMSGLEYAVESCNVQLVRMLLRGRYGDDEKAVIDAWCWNFSMYGLPNTYDREKVNAVREILKAHMKKKGFSI